MERCLYPGRRRLGIFVLVVMLWMMWTAGSARTGGSAGGLFLLCAFGAILYAGSLTPGAAWLKLNSQGFTVRHCFREQTYRWTDIKEFKLITYRYLGLIPFHRMVGFTFSESYPKRNIIVRVASAIASFDANLPDTYGLKAQDLVALLETHRRQAVGVDANRYQVPWPAIEPE